MKAKQAIDLLENGIMPCILIFSIIPANNGTSTHKTMPNDNLSSFIDIYQVDYIYGYSLNSNSSLRYSNNLPLYNFITL